MDWVDLDSDLLLIDERRATRVFLAVGASQSCVGAEEEEEEVPKNFPRKRDIFYAFFNVLIV